MKIKSDYLINVLNRFNEEFDFKLKDILNYKSYKHKSFNGSIEWYKDENVGSLTLIKAKSLISINTLYSYIFTPDKIDGPILICDISHRNDKYNIEVKFYDISVKKNDYYKVMKNKSLITKQRYKEISNDKEFDTNEGKYLLDWSISKREKNDASAILEIANLYLTGYIDLLRNCKEIEKNKKEDKINAFMYWVEKDESILFSYMRKIFSKSDVNTFIKQLVYRKKFDEKNE